MIFRIFAVLLALFVAPGAAMAGSAFEKIGAAMTPHKALYEISMVTRKSSSQVLNIGGQMFYEWKPSCEAWVTDHRFNLHYEYADSSPLLITSDFSTYEPFDGASFDYSSRRKRNGTLFQELRGRAERHDDGTGEANYSIPETLHFDLDKGTLFPMAHTLEVLDRAKRGEKFFSSTVFDGSDEDGPVLINAFIGKPANALAVLEPSADLDTTLLNTPAWNVRMAFFPLNDPSADADYEMSVVFHENGIISDMLVEYRDFSVTQKLVALEKRDMPDCGGK